MTKAEEVVESFAPFSRGIYFRFSKNLLPVRLALRRHAAKRRPDYGGLLLYDHAPLQIPKLTSKIRQASGSLHLVIARAGIVQHRHLRGKSLIAVRHRGLSSQRNECANGAK